RSRPGRGRAGRAGGCPRRRPRPRCSAPRPAGARRRRSCPAARPATPAGRSPCSPSSPYRGFCVSRGAADRQSAAYDRGVTLVVTAAQVGEPAASVPETIRRRLLPPVPSDGLLSWFATGLVVLIGAMLRMVGLSNPAGRLFVDIY